MRYKTLVTTKLENLHNTINTLRHTVYQGSTVQQVDEIFAIVKEKIEEIQTLINTESAQGEGTW